MTITACVEVIDRFRDATFSLELTKSGMTEEQAEAVVDTFREQESELVTLDRLDSALSAQLIKIIMSQLAVAALLFAAMKFFGV
jgi:hypothetical protein